MRKQRQQQATPTLFHRPCSPASLRRTSTSLGCRRVSPRSVGAPPHRASLLCSCHRDLGMLLDETPLFEPSLLEELDWSCNTVSFSPPISPSSPGEGLVLRPLCVADFNRGFFKVLSQLTKTGDVTPEQFTKKFEHMKKTGDYFVIVVEDTNLGQIVATATLITEHKFIHSCAKRGRVEEVVVSDVCRGKQLGKLLVSTLTLLSKKLNCYKITLECAPKNVAFYQKFAYGASEETYMQCRFSD
ncbi:glucosamine 6-phosphate N-acetyltransferase isoform X2 [Limanda limanda]|uniref:glucosamine 6-phosphate N-acetyltransferase isoform X2 n=1 Tax=Limanda limanda TaxID=27771 RepID=UPI0029C82B21|nr:glucosamine 6-phosphate N-acetyltransferase isoform X2 [Limanda limanda]